MLDDWRDVELIQALQRRGYLVRHKSEVRHPPNGAPAMLATDQKETWLPAVQREMDTWGVSHASLRAGIAALIACAVKEEREACAKVNGAPTHDHNASVDSRSD